MFYEKLAEKKQIKLAARYRIGDVTQDVKDYVERMRTGRNPMTATMNRTGEIQYAGTNLNQVLEKIQRAYDRLEATYNDGKITPAEFERRKKQLKRARAGVYAQERNIQRLEGDNTIVVNPLATANYAGDYQRELREAVESGDMSLDEATAKMKDAEQKIDKFNQAYGGPVSPFPATGDLGSDKYQLHSPTLFGQRMGDYAEGYSQERAFNLLKSKRDRTLRTLESVDLTDKQKEQLATQLIKLPPRKHTALLKKIRDGEYTLDSGKITFTSSTPQTPKKAPAPRGKMPDLIDKPAPPVEPASPNIPTPSTPSPSTSKSDPKKGMSAGTMAALGIGVPAVAYGGYRALRPSKDQKKQEKKTAAFVKMLS